MIAVLKPGTGIKAKKLNKEEKSKVVCKKNAPPVCGEAASRRDQREAWSFFRYSAGVSPVASRKTLLKYFGSE